ncbi:30S ribosomal protein S3, partial [Candidatus Bathyarchaeota archaeon]|nr:30S ribosomal protein S3 [Candidatus Bathyarchaeota archaeon]
PNPQITVIEVEVPELNPMIMASRVANALERGVHFRRSVFWSLNRIMESGALGCEIILKGPLRSARSRFERVVEGYVPKSGDPAQRYVKSATIHVKMKRGILGVTVNIVSPDAKFPDKVSLKNLPDIEYQLPIIPKTPEPVETEEVVTEDEMVEIDLQEEAELELEEETEVVEELETPEATEEILVEEPEPEIEETVETPEADLVPAEEEEEAEPQVVEAEPEPEPLPEVEVQEEAEKKPETEEEE